MRRAKPGQLERLEQRDDELREREIWAGRRPDQPGNRRERKGEQQTGSVAVDYAQADRFGQGSFSQLAWQPDPGWLAGVP